jgi:hypothetical protein
MPPFMSKLQQTEDKHAPLPTENGSLVFVYCIENNVFVLQQAFVHFEIF